MSLGSSTRWQDLDLLMSCVLSPDWHEKRKCYQWFWKNRSKLLTNKKRTFEKLRLQIFITKKTSSCFSDLRLYKKIWFTETTTFLVVINIQSLSLSKVGDSNAIHLHHLQVYGSQIRNSLQLIEFLGCNHQNYYKFNSCNDTTSHQEFWRVVSW